MPDALPNALRELATLDVNWYQDHDIDLELNAEFLPEQEVTSWWQAWTGNKKAEAPAFEVFGKDGSGGSFAIWRRDGSALDRQPVVFLGSEGEVGAVSKDLPGFVALLAQGVDPAALIRAGYGRSEEEGEEVEAGEPVPEAVKAWNRLGAGPLPLPGQVFAGAASVSAALRTLVEETVR